MVKNKSLRNTSTDSKKATFETQEVREIDRKEADRSRGIPILWMGIIEDVFQKEMQRPRKFENIKEKFHAR